MKIQLMLLLPLILVVACGTKESKKDPGAVVTMPLASQSQSAEPYLFSDEEGITYLTWIESKEDQSTIKYSTLSDLEWSTPVTIISGKNWFVNWADYPTLATNKNEFIVHFLERSGESTYGYDVKLTSSNDRGKSWTKPVSLHDDGKEAEHGFVSIVPWQEGFFVSWLDGRNTAMEGMEQHEGHHGEMTIRAAQINDKGEKLSEWELDNRVCDCCQTSAAITDIGPIVIYRDRSEDEIRDVSIVRLVDGQWTKPVSIFSDGWKINGCPVNGPRIVARGNHVAIAWFTMSNDEGQVKLIFSDDGGANFGKPVRIDEGNPIGRVDIIMTEGNSAMVSWIEGTTIKVRNVESDGSMDPPIVISSISSSRSSGFPQISYSKSNLIIAWTDEQSGIKTAMLPVQ